MSCVSECRVCVCACVCGESVCMCVSVCALVQEKDLSQGVGRITKGRREAKGKGFCVSRIHTH